MTCVFVLALHAVEAAATCRSLRVSVRTLGVAGQEAVCRHWRQFTPWQQSCMYYCTVLFCVVIQPVVKLGGIPGICAPPPLILDPPHFTRRSLGYCACLNAPFDLFQLFNHRAPHTSVETIVAYTVRASKSIVTFPRVWQTYSLVVSNLGIPHLWLGNLTTAYSYPNRLITGLCRCSRNARWLSIWWSLDFQWRVYTLD